MSPSTATEPAAFASLDERYERIPIEQLRESPFNPRKTFDVETLKELADSITSKGVIEPIVVRPWSKSSKGEYEIVAGARRYRASQSIGLTHLPAIIRAYTDIQIVEIMAIENGQRDDVPALEEAAGYKQLMLIDKTYTAKMIADQIGHSEKYVWDRLRLLELVPEIQELLTSGEIGVEHAEVIAKLKPAEQRSLLKGGDSLQSNRGLFTWDGALDFESNPARKKQRKPVSVRELKQYIADHVRLDLAHAARVAPLEFGETKQRVDEALAGAGRGRKVIPITFSHYCPDGAKSEDERTYGGMSWKKAQNKDGEATCDHAVLGLVVAGEQYGTSFKVCIARDRCVTHWKESVKAKEKAAKLRESGKSKQAAKVEKKQAARQESEYEREQKAREARAKAWSLIEGPVLADALAQAKVVKKLAPAVAAALLNDQVRLLAEPVKKHLGSGWHTKPIAALLVSAVDDWGFHAYGNKDSGFDQFIREVAKPYGLDVKRLLAIHDQLQPKPAAAAKDTKGANVQRAAKKAKAAA